MNEAGPPQGANAPLAGQALPRIDDASAVPASSQPGPRERLFQTTGAAALSGVRKLHAVSDRGGKRPVHGVLLLDKPLGLSSNQALQKVKWLLRAEKAGHTGTLDPLASGVLPLCFGAATKFSQTQLDADKTYEATLVLGEKTTTADAEGDVIQTRPVPPLSADALADLARRFTGPLLQVPPMYSALKKDGKALYEYARKGEEVERKARNIVIYELNLAFAQSNRARVAIKMIVKCSKGTYIRTLGEDIGEAIGCGAHLGSLRRVETGGFEVAECITLSALEALSEAERQARLLPPQTLVSACPAVTLDADNAGRFLSGLRRRGYPGQWGGNAPLVQVYGPAAGAGPDGQAAFLGSAHVMADELIPQRLLSPIEIQDMARAACSEPQPLGATATEPAPPPHFQVSKSPESQP
jgi:tRNA pseudouridine55 synthase